MARLLNVARDNIESDTRALATFINMLQCNFKSLHILLLQYRYFKRKLKFELEVRLKSDLAAFEFDLSTLGITRKENPEFLRIRT